MITEIIMPCCLDEMNIPETVKNSARKHELIRCKDCKWFGHVGCAINIVDDSDRPTKYDYCSFAERNEKNVGGIPIVRCKDCQWYDDRFGGSCHNERFGDGYGYYYPPYVTEDGFCKWGKRKEK